MTESEPREKSREAGQPITSMEEYFERYCPGETRVSLTPAEAIAFQKFRETRLWEDLVEEEEKNLREQKDIEQFCKEWGAKLAKIWPKTRVA